MPNYRPALDYIVSADYLYRFKTTAALSNYYSILGLRPGASPESIRQAFRMRAKRLHPDVNSGKGASGDFQKINEAYQVLRDPQRRRMYDLRLRQGSLGKKVYYRPGRTSAATYRPVYRPVARPGSKARPSRLERIFDHFLFFSMLLTGISALFAGIYRSFGEPVEGVNPALGILFGVVFTGLLIIVWDKKRRLES